MTPSPYTLAGARRVLAGNPAEANEDVWTWDGDTGYLVPVLDGLVAAGHRRLRDGERARRHEVLAATHAALVFGAFFAVLGEAIVRSRGDLTDDDLRRMTTGEPELRTIDGSVVLPSATAGFEPTLRTVIRPLYEALSRDGRAFAMRWTGAAEHGDIVQQAADRYRAGYAPIADDVPEFAIWTMSGHPAPAGASLERLERLVSAIVAGEDRRAAGVRDTLAALNRGVLDEPLIPVDEAGDLQGVRVPTVDDGYINPCFRWAVAEPETQAGDHAWWARRPVETDIETFLAAHLVSPMAAERPLVVLGHPGSGKSLFTKVCAGRLSAADRFTAVRIALRDVRDPDQPIYQQIDDTVRRETNGRVAWPELCEAAAGTVRVVLIDGLDELMQVTGATQSSYLGNVAEFQRVEKATGNPVAAIVTARTLVADLARIPDGSVIIKLEDFSDDQVRTWLSVWQATNATEHLTPRALLPLGDLSHQPLLLLLLAIYGSVHPLPEAESVAALYGVLLQHFLTRELAKSADPDPDRTMEQRRGAALWDLGVVAFGMLNRGRLHIGEEQLRHDLAALRERNVQPVREVAAAGRLSTARQVIGRFFFITSADGAAGRSYEFLHSTFGEYLIAYHVLDELIDLHRALARPSSQQWDDDRLFALLSHQLLSSRTEILPFARQLFRAESPETRAGTLAVLRRIVRTAQDRWGRGGFGGYDPSGDRYTNRMAAYTVNVILLLTTLSEDPVPLAAIAPPGLAPEAWWASTVDLWASAFAGDPLTWSLLLARISRSDHDGPHISGRLTSAADSGTNRSLLATGSLDEAAATNAGRAAVTGTQVVTGPADVVVAGWLAMALTAAAHDPRPSRDGTLFTYLAQGRPTVSLARPILAYLCAFGAELGPAYRAEAVRYLLEPVHAGSLPIDDLTVLVAMFPDLLQDVPDLARCLLGESGRPRTTAVGDVLEIGATAWGRDSVDLYGRAIVHTGRSPAAGRPGEPVHPAKARAFIRDAVAILRNPPAQTL